MLQIQKFQLKNQFNCFNFKGFFIKNNINILSSKFTKNFARRNFSEYILSIDQGTTSTRLALIDRNLHIKNIKQKEHNQIHKELNWTEHDPLELKENIENLIKELYNDNKKVINFEIKIIL